METQQHVRSAIEKPGKIVREACSRTDKVKSNLQLVLKFSLECSGGSARKKTDHMLLRIHILSVHFCGTLSARPGAKFSGLLDIRPRRKWNLKLPFTAFLQYYHSGKDEKSEVECGASSRR
jgi:hypothetical protein